MHDLGPSTDKAGVLGVIRVLICYPAKPNIDTVKKLANADPSHHPAATVDIDSLAAHPSDQEILESLRLRVAAAAERKRKANDSYAHVAKRRKEEDG